MLHRTGNASSLNSTLEISRVLLTGEGTSGSVGRPGKPRPLACKVPACASPLQVNRGQCTPTPGAEWRGGLGTIVGSQSRIFKLKHQGGLGGGAKDMTVLAGKVRGHPAEDYG